MPNYAKTFAATWLLLLSVVPATFAQHGVASAAFDRLFAGNERYRSGMLSPKDAAYDRAVTADGQHPYAVVLTCADSRVPPEILFDESLGRLFVVRVAGNIVDPVVLGSIEYAVEHLGVRAILLLGHSSCGAVKATLEGGAVGPNLASLVSRIKPATDRVTKSGSGNHTTTLALAIEENVRVQIDNLLLESPVLKGLLQQNEIEVRGALYDILTGAVLPIPYDPLTGRVEQAATIEHHSH